jgi:hypothetical protein
MGKETKRRAAERIPTRMRAGGTDPPRRQAQGYGVDRRATHEPGTDTPSPTDSTEQLGASVTLIA